MRSRLLTGGLPIDIPEEGLDLDGLERGLILRALDKSAGNVTRAARLLGLSRRTLQYRLEKIQGAPDGAAAAPNRAVGPADD
jgi:ActR/RegA family two-component response regulator